MRLEQKAKARRLAAALEGKVVDPVTDNEMLVRNTLIITVGLTAIIASIITGIVIGTAWPSDTTLESKKLDNERIVQAAALANEQLMIERGFVKLAAGTWVSTSCVGAQPTR